MQELIQAIAGAVAEAQDKVQRFQISTVLRYFDEFNRPVSVDVRLPSMSHDAEPGEERLVHVPLLSLVGPQLLKIKDVDVEFEVGLGSLTDAPEVGGPPAGSNDDSPAPAPDQAPDSELSGSNKVLASISAPPVTVVRAPPPASPSRSRTRSRPTAWLGLIQHLDKLI